MNKIRVGLIGYGYWGPNHARIIDRNDQCELVAICDFDNDRLKEAERSYHGISITNSHIDLLNDDSIEAVVIATPVMTHRSLVADALKVGKHVLCEKPLAYLPEEIIDLGTIAREQGKTLMCAQIFEYNSVVRYMEKYLKNEDIGDLLYIHSVRNGLGPVRKDINVVYDLATHDVSIILRLLGKLPNYVSAVGSSFIEENKHDIAFINLEFENKVIASINVSWLDPIKQRKLRVIGSKKMLVFDDISVGEKLKVINSGKSYLTKDGDFGSFQVSIKDGDIIIPNVHYEEPLQNQWDHFVDCVNNRKTPETDVENAHKVVKVLHAINSSLAVNGARIQL